MGDDNEQRGQIALRRVAVRLAPERAYIAASDVGIALKLLPGSGSPESIWFAVVSEAGKMNKLRELASWLQEDYRHDEDLSRIVDALANGGAVEERVATGDGPTSPARVAEGLSEQEARGLITTMSLGVCGVGVLYFLLAPALWSRLEFRDSLRVGAIILPMFAGYATSATLFFVRPSEPSEGGRRLPRSIVVGPFAIALAGLAAALFAFEWTNRLSAPFGGGVTRDELHLAVTVCAAFLSATSGFLSSHLFSRRAARVRDR
ncbi:MAG: hypothetical protein U0326_10045 [Polyangiales bacterium]